MTGNTGMRLATRDNGTPDGELLVVSNDGARALPAGARWPNLLTVMGSWNEAHPHLQSLSGEVETSGTTIDPGTLRAPLPRSWQWLDGSAFSTHGDLMQIAFGTDPIETTKPLMYQGLSDRFYAPHEPVPFLREQDGIDFEGEFGVIVDAVPMGVTPQDALRHIRLIVQINDWSLRALAVPEMKTGFGWIQAKPACSMAPFAVTPDQLGEFWRDGRVHLDLDIRWNDKQFGRANGGEMAFGFHELVAHAAGTRDLVAGTIIGSGTVANAAYRDVGSSCISEQRAIEMIETGKPATAFMSFGDRVRMAAHTPDGQMPFGVIDQSVVRQ
jgi:fumarylacetoacetate (FAA) hydrolase